MTGRWLLPHTLCAHPAQGMAEGRTLCIHQHQSLPPLLTLPCLQYHSPGPLPHPFSLQHDSSHRLCPWDGGTPTYQGPLMFLCRIWSHSKVDLSLQSEQRILSDLLHPSFPITAQHTGQGQLPKYVMYPSCTAQHSLLPQEMREALTHVLEAGPAAQHPAVSCSWAVVTEAQRGILVKAGRELLAGGHTACLLPKGREFTAGGAKLMSQNQSRGKDGSSPRSWKAGGTSSACFSIREAHILLFPRSSVT